MIIKINSLKLYIKDNWKTNLYIFYIYIKKQRFKHLLFVGKI